MNYLLLWQVRRLGKQKVKSINSVIASIIGAIYVCVIYIFKINFLNFAIMKNSYTDRHTYFYKTSNSVDFTMDLEWRYIRMVTV